ITPLYLVFAPSTVEDVPKGFSFATSPSVLLLTVTLVICVVLPSDLTLKSLKVELLIERGSIFSEKVAVRLVPRATPIPVGVAVLTWGFMVSWVVVDSDSKEPMSDAAPCGRATPRWSVVAPKESPLSMAGLPASKAWVFVGPPLSARGPSLGSRGLSVVPEREWLCQSRSYRPSRGCSRRRQWSRHNSRLKLKGC